MKVKIYKPTRTAMQSGVKNTKLWLLTPVEDHNSESINDVTGWTSSANTETQIKLKFPSQEEAIKYAEANNFEYEVIEPEVASIKQKSYASNFING